MIEMRTEAMIISNSMEYESKRLHLTVHPEDSFTFSEMTSDDELEKYEYIDLRTLYLEVMASIEENINDEKLLKCNRKDFIEMLIEIRDRYFRAGMELRIDASMITKIPNSSRPILTPKTMNMDIKMWGNKALITLVAKVMEKIGNFAHVTSKQLHRAYFELI